MYQLKGIDYKYKGVKLGQVVHHFDEPRIVIGFDTRAFDGEEQVALKLFDGKYKLRDSKSVDIILNWQENSSYYWAFLADLDKF